MKVGQQEQQLIEAYWQALYEKDVDAVVSLLDSDIRVTVFKEGVKIKEYGYNTLMEVVKRVTGALESVVESNKEYSYKGSKVRVDFCHRLDLKDRIITTAGYQKWQIKTEENGKMHLSALEVEEVLLEQIPKNPV